MPDVRHGCAAQSSALTAHHLHRASSRAGTSREPGLTVAGSRRYRSHPARRSYSVICLRRCRVFPGQTSAHPAPLTARPPWLAAPPAPSPPRRPVLMFVSDPLTSGTASVLALRRNTPRVSLCPASHHPRHLAPPRLSSAPATRPTGLPACFCRPGLPQPAPLPFGRA